MSVRDDWQEPWSDNVRRDLNAVMTYAEVSVPEKGSGRKKGRKSMGPLVARAGLCSLCRHWGVFARLVMQTQNKNEADRQVCVSKSQARLGGSFRNPDQRVCMIGRHAGTLIEN